MTFFSKTVCATIMRTAASSRRSANRPWCALAVLGSCIPLAAQNPPPRNPAPAETTPARLQLPVNLRQKVIAGVTPVGAPVEAKLLAGTLVSGAVIPQGATLSGHVEQSAKKQGDQPSRIKLEFDSASWKKGSAPLEVYLVGCYFPQLMSQVHHSGITVDNAHGADEGNGPGGGVSRDLPPGMGPEALGSSNTEPSAHWVRQEGTEPAVDPAGGVSVISKDRDLKLDKDATCLLIDVPRAAKH